MAFLAKLVLGLGHSGIILGRLRIYTNFGGRRKSVIFQVRGGPPRE